MTTNDIRSSLNVKRNNYIGIAAKQIDYKLNKYRNKFPNFNTEKYWVMTALELAFENMSMKDRNDTTPYLEKLKQLEQDIDECIGKKSE